uniref:Uncharacterized protein n=1 Tax=Chromera velia CCMP2878 TaxID=1169474 RepID=A0A0G4FCA8_9ALVE|eukprot:Cvel_16151.t1-p1 / transcript=Cvel_16151.t1 / gene=Cvel_16151 / organism=Chromera_velia_CCMP2878 / gene_product=hypothetical protein / transcript_product=hypothetical protein / location=Cvel_scaffold1230:8359-9528(-) / protein_length=390 / sequence_SO=supercontig / SO=protein_coding / is_pseudo=false
MNQDVHRRPPRDGRGGRANGRKGTGKETSAKHGAKGGNAWKVVGWDLDGPSVTREENGSHICVSLAGECRQKAHKKAISMAIQRLFVCLLESVTQRDCTRALRRLKLKSLKKRAFWTRFCMALPVMTHAEASRVTALLRTLFGGDRAFVSECDWAFLSARLVQSQVDRTLRSFTSVGGVNRKGGPPGEGDGGQKRSFLPTPLPPLHIRIGRGVVFAPGRDENADLKSFEFETLASSWPAGSVAPSANSSFASRVEHVFSHLQVDEDFREAPARRCDELERGEEGGSIGGLSSMSSCSSSDSSSHSDLEGGEKVLTFAPRYFKNPSAVPSTEQAGVAPDPLSSSSASASAGGIMQGGRSELGGDPFQSVTSNAPFPTPPPGFAPLPPSHWI